MRYQYHCRSCGFQTEHEQPMSEPVPEVMDDYYLEDYEVGTLENAHRDPTDGALCSGLLYRVYTFPGMSLGPEYAKYSTIDGRVDQAKYYGADWVSKHNKF